ncbi:MAG: hypothetical protein WB988_03910 [Candidatus Nitrosopolaris sp.]|jgi:hypothetical protein
MNYNWLLNSAIVLQIVKTPAWLRVLQISIGVIPTTGILAKSLDKDRGDLVHWYETYEEIYVESKRCWKRKKGYSIKPENLNLGEYKNILHNKLKDSLEITGFNLSALESELFEPIAVSHMA